MKSLGALVGTKLVVVAELVVGWLGLGERDVRLCGEVVRDSNVVLRGAVGLRGEEPVVRTTTTTATIAAIATKTNPSIMALYLRGILDQPCESESSIKNASCTSSLTGYASTKGRD
jgi:hypothetical protein